MSRKKIPLFLLAVGVLLIFVSIIWYVFSRQFGSASLSIESAPEANVYINGEMVGRTPYSGEHKAGDANVELIPLAFDSPRIPFKTSVKLTSGVNTVIRQSLGETELSSSGEIISFEKNGTKETAVAVITQPDNALVTLEGRPTEHSPVRFSDLNPGTYNLRITAPGYEERNFLISPQEGFTLTAIVDLAKLPEQENNTQPEPTEASVPTKQLVVIDSTPTGFLRVRSGPNLSAEEVAQVATGTELELLATDSETGWFKVKLEGKDVSEGWISNEYALLKRQEQ